MITEENTNIYICCHKNIFDNPLELKSKAYKIISPNEIKQNNSDLEVIKYTEEYDNRIFSEFSHIFHIAKRTDLKEYTGICHYRRYFDFKDDFSKIKDKDFVYTVPENTFNNIMTYSQCHNADDIIKFTLFYQKLYEKDDFMRNVWQLFCNSSLCYTNNMFILPTEVFKQMVNVIEKILTNYLENQHLKTYEDWKDHVILNKEKYIKDSYPNNTIWYNVRTPSYLCERLVSAYLSYYIMVLTNSIPVQKIITEDKYGIE